MGNYNPPYEITDKIVMLVASIAEKSGKIMEYYKVGMSGTNRERRIRAIHASLRMKGISFRFLQIKEIVEGGDSVSERVIRGVQNMYAVYEYMQEVETYSIADFKKAHGILTKDIASESGEFRQTEGVFNHNQFFMAPPARFIEGQMQELFAWMESQREKIHPLILSSIFHYEVLFLHHLRTVTADWHSCGRQRFWQSGDLSFPIFRWKPRWRGCREDIMRRFLSARWREALRVLLSLCWNRLRLHWMRLKGTEGTGGKSFKICKETPGSNGRRYSLYSE